MKKFLFMSLLALGSAFSFIACKDDDEPAQSNIVQLAQANPNLKILVDAVIHAGLAETLSGTTEFTVFAPTDAAFTTLLGQLGVTRIEQVDARVVEAILLYHVIPGEVKAAAINTGYVKSLSPFGTTGSNLSLYVEKSGAGVKVNGGVNVATADVDASNGVVHVVDKVITLPNVVNHALNNPNFSTLVAALTRADLLVDYVGILSAASGDNVPYTVFAPTNAAFTAFLSEFGYANLNAVPAEALNKVLQYHVVIKANVLAASLTEGQQVTTFEGQKFTIGLAGGAQITDARARKAKIVVTDVQGTNGVVHAIDKVIMPVF
jgi:uncharacterized surface protein with fasciclin (FAS1) repeats